MITLSFTIAEMTTALEKIGYKIVEEEEMRTIRTYHDNTEEIPTKVWNCIYNGEKMADWSGYGYKRLEFVFQTELHKKLLSLF